MARLGWLACRLFSSFFLPTAPPKLTVSAIPLYFNHPFLHAPVNASFVLQSRHALSWTRATPGLELVNHTISSLHIAVVDVLRIVQEWVHREFIIWLHHDDIISDTFHPSLADTRSSLASAWSSYRKTPALTKGNCSIGIKVCRKSSLSKIP